MMKGKTTEQLKEDYESLKVIIHFHSTYKVLDKKELENHINDALEIMKEILVELEKRGESI